MRIKTEERLLGKLPLLISEDLWGRDWLLLISPHFLTGGLNKHRPNFQNSFLKMDNLERQRDKKHRVFSKHWNISSSCPHHTITFYRCWGCERLPPSSPSTLLSTDLKTTHRIYTMAVRIPRMCESRPSTCHDDISKVTYAPEEQCFPSTKDRCLCCASRRASVTAIRTAA